MIEYTVRVFNSGTEFWRLNGELHCAHGPAVLWPDGDKEWWLNDRKVTEEEHKKRTSKTSCQGKVVVIDGIEYRLEENTP